MSKIEFSLETAVETLQGHALDNDGVSFIGLSFDDNSTGAVVTVRFADDEQMSQVLGHLRMLLGNGIPTPELYLSRLEVQRRVLN